MNMKRLMVTMVVLMVLSGQAIAGSWAGVLGNYPSYGGGIYGGGYGYGLGGNWNGVLGNYPSYGGGIYGYGNSIYSSSNTNVKYNERWNTQGGERSYKQSPDYFGKIIDSVTTLGALTILSR